MLGIGAITLLRTAVVMSDAQWIGIGIEPNPSTNNNMKYIPQTALLLSLAAFTPVAFAARIRGGLGRYESGEMGKKSVERLIFG